MLDAVSLYKPSDYKMKTIKCAVCGREKKDDRECLVANIDRDLNQVKNGDVVCSAECAKEYENNLPYNGKPIQHWSRITGYYQNVSGWNKGKVAELKDRKRYDI